MKKILILIAILALIGCKKEEPNQTIIKDKWQIEVTSYSQTPISYRANNTTRQITGIFSQELIANSDLNMGVTIINKKPNEYFNLTIRYNDSLIIDSNTSIYFQSINKPNR